MNQQNDLSFFDWLVSLFKKKEKPVIKPSYEELAAEAKWIMIKAQYRLEYLKEHNTYYVQYLNKRSGDWLYLRRWTEDYTNGS